MTKNDPTDIGPHGASPKEQDGVTVFNDTYECPNCQREVSVTDFAHRTHVGYDVVTIQCEDCSVGMVRIE